MFEKKKEPDFPLAPEVMDKIAKLGQEFERSQKLRLMSARMISEPVAPIDSLKVSRFRQFINRIKLVFKRHK